VSFGVVLDETGAVQDYSIHTSLIKPTYRLTYEDVDEMLDLGCRRNQKSCDRRLAQRRQRWRHSKAISILPEAMIKVQDDEITIEVLEDSQARQLVAEMMILAGEVAGRYGQAHYALPFRVSHNELP